MKDKKTYQVGFSFSRLGHAPGVGLGGTGDGGSNSEIQPNLIWCVSSHMNAMCYDTIFWSPLHHVAYSPARFEFATSNR